ncbi:chitinase [Saccharothrix australiensis]|uniref:Glycosyl hydrolase family 18 (Putative chitinase) n=1 Tax=Saccharothrix australiensis TaxID=2072 RepID=A0A495VVH2_9PSEU|nr:chitinase [Saccharothrix australiensis]RKT52697.1 glycosyl hydrolase family 18 (putative chitinase) [Saccharothrix australiensis]
MKPLRRLTIALTAGVAALSLTPAAHAAPDPVPASPYLYQWGAKPNPATIMSQTGVKAFTLAFVLSDGGCNPAWDGTRPLTGADATLIRNIRAAGGEVIPSFGGWAGRKLGQHCSSADALAAAYQKVIDAYQLTAIDIDIEAAEFENATVQDRVLGALKIVKQKKPGVRTVVTMPTNRSGLNTWGRRLVTRAKELAAPVDVWTVMPFNFGGPSDMVAGTKSAVDGLKEHVKTTFGLTDDAAYRRSGLSSMNGVTDTGETVSTADFRAIHDWAAGKHLARFTFWATNRDRGNCGASGDNCSGTNQGTYDFTKIVAGYTG